MSKQTKERQALLASARKRAENAYSLNDHVAQKTPLGLKVKVNKKQINDALFFGGFVGIVGLGIYQVLNAEATVVVEETPSDLWSFLGSSSGKALIQGTLSVATQLAKR